MKRFKLGILFVVSMLFLMSGVCSFPFSFDFEDPTILRTVTTRDRIKGFQALDGNWWLIYIDSSDKRTYVEEFNSAFVSLGRYSDTEMCHDASYCEDSDATYYVDIFGNEYIRIITLEDDNQPRTTLTDFNIDTHAFTEIVQGGDGVSNWNADNPRIDVTAYKIPIVSSDNDILILWKRSFTDTTWRYSNDNVIGTSSAGDGEVEWFESYENPDDIQVAWCNNHYYIGAFNDTSDGLFIHSFKHDVLNELEFIGTNLGIASAGGTDMSINDWSLWSEVGTSGTDILHMVALDRTEKEVYFYAWECGNDGKLTNIHMIHNDFSDLIVDDFDYGSRGVVLRFEMEDISSPIQDISGYGNDGVYNGDSYSVVGVDGNSLGFDGNDFINVTDNTSLDINGTSITLDTWVKFNTLPNNNAYQDIFNKLESNLGYRLVLGQEYSEYRIKFIINAENYYVTWATPQIDTWYHVVGVYDGSHLKIYVDGSQVGSSGAYSSAIGTNDKNLYIGSSGSGHYLNGYLDETIIYGSALNETDILYRYNTFSSTDVITKPFLTKDNTDMFRLFFQYKDYETNIYSIRTVGNFGDYACNEWISHDVCEYDKQKFTMFCSHNGTSSKWAITTYCSNQYNESSGIVPQKYEWVYGDSNCVSDWVDVGQEAKCYVPPIQIPIDCINISAFEITVPEFEGNGEDDGNFTMKACTPSVDCNEVELNCDQVLNDSVNWIRDLEESYYNAGDTVTGMSTIRADLSCKDKGIWDFSGITRYRVYGTMGYSCQIACAEEWVCMDQYNKGYRRVDCQLVNITACEFGCKDGACVGVGDGDDSALNPTFWFDLITKPNKTTKFIYSLAGSVLVGVFIFNLGKESENKPLMFLTGFGIGFAFFTLIGWIPAVIIFIIIFFVGIYFLFKTIG